MCKFNGKSIEVRTINGETVYHGKQTLLALGYSSYSHTPYKVLSSLSPSELQLPPMFYKISNLIEEYQEFRGQYMKMQEELRRLEAENARLKRNFAKAREVFTECAAGF